VSPALPADRTAPGAADSGTPGTPVPPGTAGVVPDLGTEVIVVRLGRGRFAAELSAVAEVGRIPDVTRVPGAPSWLLGVANWRGRILPVIDLCPLLGERAVAPERSSRLLVLTDRGVLVGVVVDGVEGIVTTHSDTDVAPVPAGLPADAVALLAGQIPREDGPVALLDVDAVMRLRERLPHGPRSA
jgi:chemotaxis signal transduction protein